MHELLQHDFAVLGAVRRRLPLTLLKYSNAGLFETAPRGCSLSVAFARLRTRAKASMRE